MRIALTLLGIATIVMIAKFGDYYSDFLFDSAFWAMMTFAGTLLLAIIANHQISAARAESRAQIETARAESQAQIETVQDENRKERTLQICMLYDIDPVISAAAHRLAAARTIGYLKDNPSHYRIDIISILNYFDSIAIGVARKLYDAEIVHDHMRPIMSWTCATYMRSEFFEGHPSGYNLREDYPRLYHLLEEDWAVDLNAMCVAENLDCPEASSRSHPLEG